jgi:hypothetical protein
MNNMKKMILLNALFGIALNIHAVLVPEYNDIIVYTCNNGMPVEAWSLISNTEMTVPEKTAAPCIYGQQ